MRAKEILQAIWKKYGVSLLMLTVAIALAVAEIIFSYTVGKDQTYNVAHLLEWGFGYLILPILYCAMIAFFAVTRKKRQWFDYVFFALIAISQTATYIQFAIVSKAPNPARYFKTVEHNAVCYFVGYFVDGMLNYTTTLVSITLIVPVAILAVTIPFIIRDCVKSKLKKWNTGDDGHNEEMRR